jgi:hypothetical protein
MPIGYIEYHSSATDEWTIIPPAPADEDGQRYVGGPNGTFDFLYSQVPGSSWTTPRLETAKQWIQENVLDNRISRATLPADHPYIKDGDPGQAWLFWEGTDVVERLVIVEALEVILFDSIELPRITLARVQRDYGNLGQVLGTGSGEP